MPSGNQGFNTVGPSGNTVEATMDVLNRPDVYKGVVDLANAQDSIRRNLATQKSEVVQVVDNQKQEIKDSNNSSIVIIIVVVVIISSIFYFLGRHSQNKVK